MNSLRPNQWIAFGVVVCIALAVAQSGSSQEPKVKTYPRRSSDPYAAQQIEAAKQHAKAAAKQVAAARAQAEMFKFVIATGGPEGHSEVRQAAEAVRDAKDDNEKEKAESKLRELLEDSFDADMSRRKESLIEMEDRLKKLQRQLERRREKMEEIVDLQMKVLVNEADGLGFYSGGAQPFEVPIIGDDQNNPFGAPLRINYQPTPVRISAPIPVPTIAPAPAAAPAEPVPPIPAASERE